MIISRTYLFLCLLRPKSLLCGSVDILGTRKPTSEMVQTRLVASYFLRGSESWARKATVPGQDAAL